MRKLLSALVAIGITTVSAAALACGAPIETAPGRPGTALAEVGGGISVFVATRTGYSWERLSATDWTRTHVLDVDGTLSGNIETDARSERAIAGKDGAVVELAADGVHATGFTAQNGTPIFGSAIDSKGRWQVIAYEPATTTLSLFSESAPGTFSLAGSAAADCGSPSMLDVVVEPDDTLVSLCSGREVHVASGALVLDDLPASAMGLGRSGDGHAVFYGVAENGTDLVRMSRGAHGFAVDAQLANAATNAQWLIPVSEQSIMVSTGDGYVTYAKSDDAWTSSTAMYADSPVMSAFGAPAQVLTGQYELTLHTYRDGSWTETDLGAMGVAPTYAPPSGGCGSVDGGFFGLLVAAVALARARRT